MRSYPSSVSFWIPINLLKLKDKLKDLLFTHNLACEHRRISGFCVTPPKNKENNGGVTQKPEIRLCSQATHNHDPRETTFELAFTSHAMVLMSQDSIKNSICGQFV